VFVVAWLMEQSGHDWKIHGDGVVLVAPFLVTLAFAFRSSLVSLARDSGPAAIPGKRGRLRGLRASRLRLPLL
jgi:hypothetical protein